MCTLCPETLIAPNLSIVQINIAYGTLPWILELIVELFNQDGDQA